MAGMTRPGGWRGVRRLGSFRIIAVWGSRREAGGAGIGFVSHNTPRWSGGNPKSEARNPKQARNSKCQARNVGELGSFRFFGCWLFAFGSWPGGIGFVSHNRA